MYPSLHFNEGKNIKQFQMFIGHPHILFCENYLQLILNICYAHSIYALWIFSPSLCLVFSFYYKENEALILVASSYQVF